MSSAHATPHRFNRPGDIPPLRASPFESDAYDEQRCAWVKSFWHSQDDMLRPRDRQVEENLRMLLGQQWIVWSDLRGKYVNLAETLSDDERRWRHMPVLNRLFLWYVLLHARMTENPPVLSWQAGPDRVDALLAEVADPLFKHVWYDVEMLEVLDRLFSWMIPSGRAYLKSRIDETKGEPVEARGPAVLELMGGLLGPDGQPIRRYIEDAPYQRNGDGYEPAAELYEDGDDYSVRETAPAAVRYEGGIEVDVVTCLEVRGEWGEATPWHRKAWHCHRSMLTPLQAYEAFGIEVEPDVRGQQAEDMSVLWRMLQGAGLFGSADGKRGQPDGGQEFVTIYELWHRPSRRPGWERTRENPGGRLCVVTGGGKVIRDGVRTAPFRYTSPIRCFDFVNLPGRPQGTSPQEFLNGPSRTRNRLHAQILGHATQVANPIRVVDSSTGLKAGDVPNIPGAEVEADLSRAKGDPIRFVTPGQLGSDVYNATDRLSMELDQLGNISGTEGAAPTADASGELVKELRFNADRPIAATMRRMVVELGRLAEDWLVLVPYVWDQEKVISIVGEDGIARTITVWPDLFKQGNINVRPEVESMLPESRGERQQRAFAFYQNGLYGEPGSREAINKFFDEARFPHMSRLVRPGGADRSMAEQNVGRLLKGEPAEAIEIFPWYDLALHREVLEVFLKSPEYLKLQPEQKAEFARYWEMLRQAEAAIALMEAKREEDMVAAAAANAAANQAELAEAARPDGLQDTPERGPTGPDVLPRADAAVA